MSTPSWKGRSIVSVTGLDAPDVSALFARAETLRADPVAAHSLATGRLMACAFYEASTRTHCSFTAAMQRLGGAVQSINASTSSVKKGETLEDTVRTLACYADILVLRHPDKGSAAQAAECLSTFDNGDGLSEGSAHRVPVLNAGDGAGEHPTQALLDLYTILREQKLTLESTTPLTVVLCGDLKYGRTTHSLAKLMRLYAGPVVLHYVAPPELQMPAEVMATVTASGGDRVTQKQSTDLTGALVDGDVLYMTRVQKERFASEAEYDVVKDAFVLTADLLDSADKAKTSLTIMHPLPRVNEIAVEVDSDPRAAYFRQMRNGMFVRMAIVAEVLGL
jgi:aspartate carbamoyltransferase